MRKVKTLYKVVGCLVGAHLLCALHVSAQDGYVKTSKTKSRSSVVATGDSNDKQTLITVLKELNRKKGVYFLFSEENLGAKTVNAVKDPQAAIEKILDAVLENTGLKYKKVANNTFVILNAKDKFRKNENYNAAEFDQVAPTKGSAGTYEEISGRITGDNGAPLVGVSINVKGTNKGTTTNSRGEFTIDANRGDVLVISYVGYNAREVTVGNDRSLSISLSLGGQDMTEVVVTALGIRKEAKRLGYSVTKVDGEGLTKAREINVANGLVGKVAGVNVSGVNGGPGSSSNVVIRGVNSFTGGQPLYVINGVPIDNSNRGSAGMWGGADMGDGISNINPDDIEEISVLKGSTASALYGSRASNGVILITTKTGRNKKGIGVEVNSNFVVDNIIDYSDFQYQYGQGLLGVKPTNQANAYASGNSSWGARIDGSNAVQFDGVTRPYSAQSDNIKNFYQTGSTATNSLAFSGGSDNTNFRLSVANLMNKSVVPGSDLKRNSVNLNVSSKLSKRLMITAIINYITEKSKNRPNLSDSPGNSNFGILFLPTTLDQEVLKPGYKPDGSEINFSQNIFVTNPWFAANRWVNDLSRNRIIAMGSIRYNFTDWLYLQGRFGQDYFSDRTTGVTPTGTAYYPAGNITENSNKGSEINADFLVGVDKNLTKDISLNLSLGGNLRKNRFEQIINTGDQFSIPFLYVLDNAKNKNSDYNLFRQETQSLYYAAEFGYKNFLFLSTTGREDWFSTLPIANNHLFYPSVSASFIFSEFLKTSWLDYGKFRAAWANTSGEARPYQTKLYYGIAGSINGYPIGTINNNSIPNAALQPYRMTEFEVGTELRFLKSRLMLDIAYFKRKTIDEIVNVPASITSGYTSATINIGEMQNKGIEFVISGTPIKKGNFTWSSSFNFTKLNNKVLKLSGDQKTYDIEGAQSRTQNAWGKHIVGLPASQVMAFDYKRNASGEIIFDANGRPQQGILTPMGSGFHDKFGGWNNEITFKNFNLGVLIDFKAGGKLFSATNYYATVFGLHQMTLQGRETGIIGDGVNEAGARNAISEDAWDYYGALATNVSSEFVYSASFVKLRQIVIGYNLPATMFRKLPIQGINISLVGRNLAILKKDTPNIDPESNYSGSVGQGLELAGVPPFRSFGLNVNVKF
ncbi:MAG: SusC/RagA family TonB-linked outer membrane protein [Chitinophagaceae bacterium]|nr:SusC/RagA family TonB-linked outer membrane protein [Chitinophagaceae bacterium]